MSVSVSVSYTVYVNSVNNVLKFRFNSVNSNNVKCMLLGMDHTEEVTFLFRNSLKN